MPVVRPQRTAHGLPQPVGAPLDVNAAAGRYRTGVGRGVELFFNVPPSALIVYPGFFAGFLLYIGVTGILPEAHSGATPAIAVRLIGLTCAGAMFVFVVSRFA